MRSRIYVLAFIVLVLIYLGVVFGLPANPTTLERYGLSQAQARLLNVSVSVPFVLIWLTALYGFVSLRNYAHSVANTKEGRAFRLLTFGLMVLAFSLPINAITSSVVRHIVVDNPHLLPSLTITRNYLTVLLSLTLFWLLVAGARALVKTIARKSFPDIPVGFTSGLMILTVLYTWFITSKPFNQGAEERVYFLPTWLLLATILIPYLLAWKAGLLATYYLYKYHQNVKGVIYKSAFKDLAIGIGVVVGAAIFIQLITTSSAQLNRLNLTPVLFIVYGLLAMYAVGFGFIARGANKLKRLEEV